jgi:signal-transduction protein with cAMP-binding, CBS, and nucleotidyltransferase domain
MMTSKIHPSPAIIVRGDTSIAECVQLMRDQNVGSVLVVNDRGEGDLIGIFTERDLVKKFSLIQSGGHWSRPIRTVMTEPVETLDVSDLNRSAELMLRLNIRHLPITYTPESDEKKIIMGVVSMRDLFRMVAISEEGRNQLFPRQSTQNSQLPLLKLALISSDPHFTSLVQEIVPPVIHTEIKCHSSLENEVVESCHLLFLDIDSLNVHQWPNFLKVRNQDPLVELIVVAFDPSHQSEEVTQILEKLGASQKFWIFKKPVNLSHLLGNLLKFAHTRPQPKIT